MHSTEPQKQHAECVSEDSNRIVASIQVDPGLLIGLLLLMTFRKTCELSLLASTVSWVDAWWDKSCICCSLFTHKSNCLMLHSTCDEFTCINLPWEIPDSTIWHLFHCKKKLTKHCPEPRSAMLSDGEELKSLPPFKWYCMDLKLQMWGITANKDFSRQI